MLIRSFAKIKKARKQIAHTTNNINFSIVNQENIKIIHSHHHTYILSFCLKTTFYFSPQNTG